MIYVTLSRDKRLRFWRVEACRTDWIWLITRWYAIRFRPAQDMAWWMSED